MKLLFVTLLLAILGINGNAQFLGLKGLTVRITSSMYIENDEPKSSTTDQLYAISFSDKILTHIVYADGGVSDSQMYQVENDTNFMDGENTIYQFDALSGVTGKRFGYEIKIDSEGALISLKLTQPDGAKEVFKGAISKLKTFIQ